MSRRFALLPILLLISLPLSARTEPISPADSQAPDLAAHTVVVYNRADPDSQSLAETYASTSSN